MALAALLAAVVVLSIAGQAQHAPWQVTVLSPESYPLAGGTQQILDLAASALLPGYAFAQSVTLDPTPTGSITDAGALELLSPRGIATFTSDGRTYAAVASFGGSFVGGGVQILDITDPRNIAAAGHIPDSSDTELSGAWGIATFTSDGRTYAAVTSQRGDAVQILDVTDPYSVTAAGSITDSSGDLVLESPRGIAVFVSGNSTYAAVAASGDDNGVQILNVTDPYSVTAAGSVTNTDDLELKSPRGIAIFESGNSTYAAVAASGGGDDGVQILNITDPYSVTAAGSIANIRDLELDGARSIAIFESGNSTYAAVAATFDDAVQILNITDPYSVTAAGSVTNTDDLELERPRGIATFTSGGSAYAAVAASDSDVVQILDVTDPHSVTAAGSINNTDGLKLDGPQAIAIFESGGGTYAAVAARDDDGVQIIHLAGNNAPTVDTGPDQTVSEGEPVSLPWSASDDDDVTLMYVWSQSPADPAITLVSPDSSPTTFTAPPVDSKTVIALTLTASDGTASSSDTLRVTITGPAVGARLNLTAAGSIIDTDALRLKGASGVAVFASGGSTYAAVTAFNDGVQILDVTDPHSVAAAGSIAGDDALELSGPAGIAIFNSTGGTYAAVAASTDSGVQILNVTDPYSVTAAGSINNTDALELDGPQGIAIFESGGGTYAVVAAYVDDGVQILDVSDPYSVTAAGGIDDTGTLLLDGATDIATFESGGRTYAAVAAQDDNGVQILDISDPSSVTAAGSITNTDDLKLDGARGIAVFVSGNSTYAAVAAYRDNAVQILNITDPSDITAAGNITDAGALKLQAPRGIAVFVSGNSTYAAVTAFLDDGIQILDVTDPSSITAAGRIGDNNARVLGGAWDIATFTSGGGTYAAVTAGGDHGVQIIRLADNNAPTVDAGPDQTVSEGEPVSLPWSASDDDDTLTYTWSQSPADPAITLISPDSSPTTFTAPPVDSKTVIALTLTVSDGTASSSDTLRVTITDPSDIPLTAAGSIIDTDDLKLKDASAIVVFASGGRTYAAVAAFNEGVQILDVTDPYRVTAAGSIADGGDVELSGASDIATFTSGGGTYAAVTAYGGNAVQILNITDPSSITAAGSITDTSALRLKGAESIATFNSSGGTYAAVASFDEDAVQILNMTDPSSITAAGSITDATKLKSASGVAIFASGDSTYAAVVAYDNDSVQILDVTDPHSVTAADGITNGSGAPVLGGPRDIAIFESGGGTYAAVAARDDDGVQILNVTDPSGITAASSITGVGYPALDAVRDIAIFKSGGGTYAAVASYADDGIQILNITNPYNVTAAGSITNSSDAPVLGGAYGIDTFESGGSTYAAVAAFKGDGVQIIRLTDGDTPQVTPNSPPEVEAGDDLTVAEGATVTLSGTATDDDPGDTLTYEWTHDSALAITIAGSDSLSASFAAPDVAADTTITVTLTVSDGTVDVSDALQVTITDSAAIPPGTNSPPTVNVGQDRTVSEGEPVSLPWSASDKDGDPLTYAWSQSPAVPAIAFASPGSSPTTFTAPRVDSDTLFTLTLTANDGTGDGADSLHLTVRDSGSSSGGSSSGGSSSGGSSSGGGGGGAPAEIITDVRIYSVSWDCTAGSVTVTAGPDTGQLSVNIRTSSAGERPVTRADETLHGTRAFTSSISGADEFVVVEASLAHEGGHVTTKIVNLRQCVGTVGFDRYEPLQQAVPRPEPEPQELCRDGRAPALRDGNELLCLFPGTFEVLVERGWNLARP